MPTIAVIHHLPRPFMGQVAALRDAGATVVEHDRLAGDPLPALDGLDGLVTLGGGDSVRDIAHHPYLLQEAALLREAVAREVPVLGICLGGQLLAHALGGEVRRAAQRQVAWLNLEPTDAGAADPLFGGLPAPVPALHWNEDVFSLPPGAAELLARPGEGVEAFRAGACAWGVQFHPDVDAATLDGWYAAYGSWLAGAGTDEDAARAADAVHLTGQAATADALFGGFVRRARAARDRAPR
jgi:GMP synthase-like glutamine amidotransferase